MKSFVGYIDGSVSNSSEDLGLECLGLKDLQISFP